MRSNATRQRLATFVLMGVISAALLADERTTPRFLADDPIQVDDDTRVDASGVVRRDLGRLVDFVLNSFRAPGDRRNVPAQNVNTHGDVPDSSWFTNRIGSRPLAPDAVVRGPDRAPGLTATRWVIVEGKDTGRQPGFRAINPDDPTGRVHQIEFDPRSNPEMATGAEIIGTAIYHAIGYNVVETYLIEIDTDALSIAPTATVETAGRRRAFTPRDLRAILRNVARMPNGRYRATASPFAEGRYVGPFRYYGTRPDDPNDIVPHEHRRELRGNRVFAAWLNHDDSRAGNSLDMLICPGGRCFVTHYMFDFGSILGSGTNEEDHPWAGHEYLVEAKPGLGTLGTFGLWRRPYLTVRAPSGLPAAGNFTADGFDPARWKPHYPNPAFDRLQPEDAFWAARIVAAFSPDAIAAIVRKAVFSDPRVTDHVTGTLLRRRSAVLRTWLPAISPLVNPSVGTDDVLRFENVAEAVGLVEPGTRYVSSWFGFDNASGARWAVSDVRTTTDAAVAIPSRALAGAGYALVEVRALQPAYPNWQEPVRFYLRRAADGWAVVGIDRGPTGAPIDPGPTRVATR